jgi:hypothetical protein
LAPAPLCWREKNKTSPEILKEIDDLLAGHTHDEIAIILNQRGLRTRVGNPYAPVRIIESSRGMGLRVDTIDSGRPGI